MTVEGKTETKPTGSRLFEPYGMVHQWGNPGDTPLVLLQANISPEGVPAVIPAEACYLGWQESLTQLAMLVEPEIPNCCRWGSNVLLSRTTENSCRLMLTIRLLKTPSISSY